MAALGSADRDALREIGIDLAQVRDRVEAVFGTGALDRPRPRRTGLLRRRVVPDAGRRRFSDAAKRALEQSLRQSLALRQHSIGSEHILLGLLAEDDDPAARTLRRLGVSPAGVRTEVRARLRRAA